MADATVHSGIIALGQPSSSGHTMNVSTGCTVFDENVSLSTAAGAVKNHGVTICNTTNVRVVDAPVKGVRKKMIFMGTTKGAYLRTGGGATINNSTDDVLAVTLASTIAATHGYPIELFGYSTAQWYMGACPSTSVTLALSSST